MTSLADIEALIQFYYHDYIVGGYGPPPLPKYAKRGTYSIFPTSDDFLTIFLLEVVPE
jgi:hypothetical protein